MDRKFLDTERKCFGILTGWLLRIEDLLKVLNCVSLLGSHLIDCECVEQVNLISNLGFSNK